MEYQITESGRAKVASPEFRELIRRLMNHLLACGNPPEEVAHAGHLTIAWALCGGRFSGAALAPGEYAEIEKWAVDHENEIMAVWADLTLQEMAANGSTGGQA